MHPDHVSVQLYFFHIKAAFKIQVAVRIIDQFEFEKLVAVQPAYKLPLFLECKIQIFVIVPCAWIFADAELCFNTVVITGAGQHMELTALCLCFIEGNL